MFKLKRNPFTAWEDKIDPEIPTATLEIYEFLQGHWERKQVDTHINRASAANMCPKRRWYQGKGNKGAPLTPRKQINFLLGDLAEKALIYYITQGLVGEGKTYSEVRLGTLKGEIEFQGKPIKVFDQIEFTTEIGDMKISGHPDGLGKRNSDGKWELIEIKSAANYGFKEFKAEGAGDYLKQAHALMMSNECKELDVRDVRFFYLRKETGHIWDRLHQYDEMIASRVKEEFQAAVKDEAPPAPYDLVDEMSGWGKNKRPTGRKTAVWQCQYCPYLEKCKGKFKLEFKKDQWGSQKPLYIFKEGE